MEYRNRRSWPGIILLAFVLTVSFPSHISAQTNFVKYPGNPVIDGEAGTERERAAFPAVIFHDDVFKMYYAGWGWYNVRQVYYAESTDGIGWWEDSYPVIPSPFPYGWDKNKFPCSVLWVDDTLRMWYWGSVDWFQYAIGYAWSEDGEYWTVHPDPVLEHGEEGSGDSEYVMWPAVIYDSNMYHMWYSGAYNWYDDNIFYATSTNGIDWEKHTFPVIENGPDGTYYDLYVEAGGVLKYNDTIHMYFMGWDDETYRIGYAWSIDYFNWTVSDTAILDVGESHEWDGTYVGPASVMVHSEQLKMWYGGQRGAVYGIGYATGDSIWNPGTGYEDGRLETPFDMTVFPNPCSGELHLEYSISDIRYSIFELYSIEGLKVRTLMNEEQQPGEYEMTFDISSIPAGVYILVMQTGEGRVVEKIMKVGGGL